MTNGRDDKYVVRRGTAAATIDGVDFELVITPESAGWGYSSLRILQLPAGGSAEFDTGPDEMVVLPMSGAVQVFCGGQKFDLAGRRGVFSRVTDFAYLPMDAHVMVVSRDGGRFALPGARATRKLPARYGPAEGVGVELRGAGQASRQVNNFCTPETFEADKLIAVEVLTPAGNWSSYPPHKHDEQRDGEAQLEEIYYFEIGDERARSIEEMSAARTSGGNSGGSAPRGMGYQRVYTSGPGREIDVCAEVRAGDTVLIPHGWHGPSMAVPGYPLYYLNVMAGPSPERAWLICDDPAHAWVRDTWADQPVDPRLPLTGITERSDSGTSIREERAS